MTIQEALSAYKIHLRSKELMAVISLAFLLMGSFVTLYNYIGYLLEAPPYHLSQAAIGSIFIVYLSGTFSSVFMGKQADKYGNKPMLLASLAITASGALLTLLPSLAAILAGIVIFTFGFFASHSIASAWVGELAKQYKAQASSLYLLFYYLGSSFVGFGGGYFLAIFSLARRHFADHRSAVDRRSVGSFCGKEAGSCFWRKYSPAGKSGFGIGS